MVLAVLLACGCLYSTSAKRICTGSAHDMLSTKSLPAFITLTHDSSLRQPPALPATQPMCFTIAKGLPTTKARIP